MSLSILVHAETVEVISRCAIYFKNQTVCSFLRLRRSSLRALQRSRSGVRSTTCVTGSWCGPTALSKTGPRPTTTQTCSARRASGPRCSIGQTSNTTMMYTTFTPTRHLLISAIWLKVIMTMIFCCCIDVCLPWQAGYVSQKASILSMMSEEEVKETGENVVELFRWAGKCK